MRRDRLPLFLRELPWKPRPGKLLGADPSPRRLRLSRECDLERAHGQYV